MTPGNLANSDHDATHRRSIAFLAALVAVVLAMVIMAAAPSARAAAKGIADHRLEYHGGIDLNPVSVYAADIGPANLDAKWTRVFAYWDQLHAV